VHPSRLVLLAAFLCPVVSHAQDEARQLREELEQAKRQIERIEKRLRDLENAPIAATPASPAPPISSALPQTASASDVTRKVYRPPERFEDDQVGEPRSGDRDVRGDRKGFIEFPETGARLRIGGFVKMDAMYDTRPMGTRDWFVPSSIPTSGVDASRGPQFGMNARASRLNLDWRRPTELGEIKGFIEFNFFGSDRNDFVQGPHAFNLPHAYLQVGPWTAGRTFSLFMDIDSYPDTLDFYGPNSAAFAINTQLRYARALGQSLTLAGSVESPPAADGITCTGFTACSSRKRAPDLVTRVRWENEHGHVQLSLAARHLAYGSGAGQHDSALAGGVNVSGSYRFGELRDYLVWGAFAGRGLQRYISGPSYLGSNDATVLMDGTLQPMRTTGGFAGYTHSWTDRLRSTFVAALVGSETSDLQPVTAYGRTGYYSINVISDLLPSLSIGGELLYGTNRTRDSLEADTLRLMLSAQYRLNH
jgi:hypothetical protein